jgi:hypothetical protein
MLGKYRVAAQLVVSRVVLSSTELVSIFINVKCTSDHSNCQTPILTNEILSGGRRLCLFSVGRRVHIGVHLPSPFYLL